MIAPQAKSRTATTAATTRPRRGDTAATEAGDQPTEERAADECAATDAAPIAAVASPVVPAITWVVTPSPIAPEAATAAAPTAGGVDAAGDFKTAVSETLEALAAAMLAAAGKTAGQDGTTTTADPAATAAPTATADAIQALRGPDGEIDLAKFAKLAQSVLAENPDLAKRLIQTGLSDGKFANLLATSDEPARAGTEDPLAALLSGVASGFKITVGRGDGGKTPNGGLLDGSTLVAAGSDRKPADAAAVGSAALFAQLLQDAPTMRRDDLAAGTTEEAAITGVEADTKPAPTRFDLAALGPQQAPAKPEAAAAQAAAPAQPFRSLLQAPPTDQISLHLVKAAQDKVEAINIALNPAELGRVDVRLTFGADGTVSAAVQADNPATLDLLMKDQRNLERSLQEAGVKTDSGSLSFNLRGDDGRDARQQQARHGGQHDGQGGAWWRGGDDGADLDTGAAQLAAARARRARLDDGALDIRV